MGKAVRKTDGKELFSGETVKEGLLVILCFSFSPATASGKAALFERGCLSVPDGSPVKVPFRHYVKSNGVRAHRAVRFFAELPAVQEKISSFSTCTMSVFVQKQTSFVKKAKFFKKDFTNLGKSDRIILNLSDMYWFLRRNVCEKMDLRRTCSVHDPRFPCVLQRRQEAERRKQRRRLPVGQVVC